MADSNEANNDLSPPKEKSFFIFGRDIAKIPCFRNSLLYGIYGGLGFGLGHFLFKSSPLKACNFATFSFAGITLVYWFQCRYKYGKTKFEMLKLQELLRRQAIYEGTEKDSDHKTE